MPTIFVAYGGPEGREEVLAFAAERAAASGDDLYVYHAGESVDEEGDSLRREIDGVVERTAPGIDYEVAIEPRQAESDATNVSTQKRLVDAIFDDDREFAYVVMGNVKHGAIESLTIPSMTEAVLDTHDIPVVLAPV
jgi:nucleotide-binding universal stress UspA family protein